MNQLVTYTEPEIQDLNGDGNTWFTSMLDVKKNNNHNILGAAVSEKEMKIRSELEMEVERDLEEEIKDGLCNLSLRLHRLYQRQKEREGKEALSSEDKTRTKSLSEVNICIKLDGKTKVEIKETKKEATADQKEKGHRRSWSHKSEDVKQVSGLNGKKVDWEKALRGGSSGTVPVNRTNNGGRISNRDSSGRVKRQGYKANHKILQLAWKV